MTIAVEKIYALVEFATMATSADNCQPWTFRWDGKKLSLLMDRERSGFFYDINHESTYMTLGAAAENIRIAASSSQLEAKITFADSAAKDRREAVANITFEPGDIDVDPLFTHLPNRRINRYPFKKQPLQHGIPDQIEQAINSAKDVDIVWVTAAAEKKICQSVVYQADKILFEDERLHRGLFKWIWTAKKDQDRLDGMGLEILGLSPLQKPFFNLIANWNSMTVLNKFKLSCLPALNSVQLLKSAPAYALLTIKNTGNKDYFNAGMALERFWIQANALGLAVQPMAGFVFLLNHWRTNQAAAFSDRHRALIGEMQGKIHSVIKSDSQPLMFFRLGYPTKENLKSKRRPVDVVLTVE